MRAYASNRKLLREFIVAAALSFSAFFDTFADAADTSAPVRFIDIDEPNGPVGRLCEPTDDMDKGALIFIGGSAGGLAFAEPAAAFACRQGFTALALALALALAYWKYEGLPSALEEIPLEYFDRAIDWLAQRPSTRQRRVGLVGYSRGGEAALLIASRNSVLAAVAALVPGSHVGPNIDFSDFFDVQSAWSVDGKALPFVTTRPNQPGADWRDMLSAMPEPSPEGQRADFEVLKSLAGAEAAEIPVQRIGVPILLISAGQDDVWASGPMASFIVEKLDSVGFPFEVQANSYGKEGHSFMLDALLEDSAVGNGESAWLSTIEFFERHFD